MKNVINRHSNKGESIAQKQTRGRVMREPKTIATQHGNGRSDPKPKELLDNVQAMH